MSPDRAVLHRAIERGEQEGGSVEFKERLTKDLHLAEGRRESLAAQLRHRVLSGDGEATYVVGVTDDGGIAGIAPDDFSESMDVLSLLAEEAGAHIDEVQTWGVDEDGRADTDDDGSAGGLVGVASVTEGTVMSDDAHIVVGTAGHVDHGKSTLVGSLVTGEAES
jgi:elongation factor 1-alpha